MAAQAKSICASPGCSVLCEGRRCPKHDVDERKQYDAARRNDPYRAIYKTAQWGRMRSYILGRDPLCRIAILCVERFGHPMPSEVVDHIAPMRRGGDAWDEGNLQGACKACHDRKTAMEDSGWAGGSTTP
jgi:5-methylcytosine-specific restriction protein A